jgi:hypothetical protein
MSPTRESDDESEEESDEEEGQHSLIPVRQLPGTEGQESVGTAGSTESVGTVRAGRSFSAQGVKSVDTEGARPSVTVWPERSAPAMLNRLAAALRRLSRSGVFPYNVTPLLRRLDAAAAVRRPPHPL